MPLWQTLRSPPFALRSERLWLHVKQSFRAGPLMGGVLVVAVVLGSILYTVVAIDHERVRTGAEESAQTLSLALKTQLETSLAETDRLLSALGMSLPQNASLSSLVLPPSLSGAALLSPEGHLVSSIGTFGTAEEAQAQAYVLSLPVPAPPSGKGVTVVADSPPPPSVSLGKVAISTPVRFSSPQALSTETNESWALLIARPVLNHAQDLIGWTVAVFDPNAFGTVFRALGMKAENVMAVLRQDGAVIGHVPYRTEGNRAFANRSHLLSTLIPRSPQGTYWGSEDSLLNGQANNQTAPSHRPPSMIQGSQGNPTVYAYSVLNDYPLIAVVGVSAKEALAGWMARAITLAFVGCGGLLALLFLSQRITRYLLSLHQSEQRYRAAEMHLSHAQSLAHIGSWEWTLHNNQMWWSAELIRIYGLSHRFEHEAGQNDRAPLQPSYDLFLTLVHPEDRAKVAIVVGRALQDGQSFAIDYRISLKDSVIRHMHHEGQCVLEEDGSVGRMDCVIQDVTESATLHAQLAQAAKLSTLGEMAAGMAHELSQPLNIMKMSVEGALFELDARSYSEQAQLALPLRRAVANGGHVPWDANGDTPNNPERAQTFDSLRSALERIALQSNRMGQILDHIRIFSQKDAAPANIFDGIAAVAVAGDVMKSQCENAGVDLRIEIPQAVAPVKGRAVQLEQVLVNLLANAKDSIIDHQAQQRQAASESFGTPLYPAPHGHIRLSAQIVGNSLLIQVCDNGAGIPPDLFTRLFEPFFTTKGVGQGTGLGLSVAYGIITAMEGDLSARNETLGGACFEIRLPLQAGAYIDPTQNPFKRTKESEEAALPAKGIPEQTSRPADLAHILIVESSPLSSALLRALLMAQGFDASIASTSKEAERLLKARPARLIILDHEDLSHAQAQETALELCQELRRIDPLVPLLHLLAGSEHSTGEVEGTTVEDRAVYSLEIPHDRSKILTVLRSLLGIPEKRI